MSILRSILNWKIQKHSVMIKKKKIDDRKRDDIDREPNSFSKNVEQPRTTMRFHDRAGLPTDASLYATIDVETCNQQSFLFLFAVLITLWSKDSLNQWFLFSKYIKIYKIFNQNRRIIRNYKSLRKKVRIEFLKFL